MNTRDWPIRRKLIALVAVPVAALLALWIFATTLAAGPALNLLAAGTLLQEFGRPGETLVGELQRERRLSLVHLAVPGDRRELSEQRLRTDRAVTDLRRRFDNGPLRDAASDLLETRIEQLFTALDALPASRQFIDRREMDRPGALGLYSGVVAAAFKAFEAMVALPDDEYSRQARALTALGQARELLGQADALLAGAATAGQFVEGEHTRLVQIIGNHRFLVTGAVADLPADERVAYQRLTEEDAFSRLRDMQEQVVAADRSAPPAVAIGAWQAGYDTVQQRMREFELDAADALADRTVPLAVGILGRLAGAGLLGLAAVVVAVVVALRVGRSLVQRLTGVRNTALEMAEHRLPSVVARLRRGEEVDTAREVPPLEFGNDEIGQVGQAFSEVQRTAVRSAVDEATLRRGLNEVFLNIARRSQGLLHRQLALLDRMERRTEAPEELAELFQVDHLATRMRRHAEDLVILAGAAPGRGWRNPVSMIDVIRGAVSEIESYDRVEITVVHPAAIVGRAVGDVIHLLAELIENATVFSAPRTRVQVGGQPVGNGYVIEVSDHGLGLPAEVLAEANRKLAWPPDFDPADSARLGLFVVARLAARHGIRVRLRPSTQGGVTAVVLVPNELVTDEAPTPVAAGPGGLRQVPTADSSEQGARRLARVRRLSTVPRQRPERSAGPAGEHPDRLAPADGARPTRAPFGVVPSVRPAAAPADVDLDTEGLPRRVRQRSLAPQLRESSTANLRPGQRTGSGSTDPGLPVVGGGRESRPPVDEPAARSPEEVRAVMSALQAGTARGRRAAGPNPVDPPSAPRPEIDAPTTELPRVRPGVAPAAEPDTETGRDA